MNGTLDDPLSTRADPAACPAHPLARRSNDVPPTLAVLSILSLAATLIWGINVGIPGGGNPKPSSPAVCWLITGASVALVAGVLAHSRRTHWL